MADPRKQVAFDGILDRHVTFEHDNTITYDSQAENGSPQAGRAVTVTADKRVGLAGDGEAVLGRLTRVESDGFCVVQIVGYMEFPKGDGATLTLGSSIVGDLGAGSAEGFVQSAPTGSLVGRGIVVDTSDPNVVGVFF